MPRRIRSTCAPKGTGPKSKSGVRAIPLIPYMRAILDERKAVQRAKLAAIGVEQTGDTPIC